MRKQLVYIVAAFVLLLSACTQKGVTETSEKQKEGASVDEVLGGDSEKVNENESEEVSEDEEVVEEATGPLYELTANWSFKPIGEANPKAVLLTIDDAPDKRALDMAKTLKELNAPAIFFVNGHFIDTEEEQAVLKEIYDMGFSIGNHTKTHPNLKQISEVQQEEEILAVSDSIETIIGERPKFFRAPFGVNSEFSKELVKQDGMLLMNWSYGFDWEKEYMDATALSGYNGEYRALE